MAQVQHQYQHLTSSLVEEHRKQILMTLSLQARLGLWQDQLEHRLDLLHQQVVYLEALALQQHRVVLAREHREHQVEHLHQQMYQDLLEQLTLEAIQEEEQHSAQPQRQAQPLAQHLAQHQYQVLMAQ